MVGWLVGWLVGLLTSRKAGVSVWRNRSKVVGRGGAAEMLDVKPTTLASRMKTLGIRFERGSEQQRNLVKAEALLNCAQKWRRGHGPGPGRRPHGA